MLRFGLLPWQLVLFACGLFLVVAAASAVGLQAVLGSLAGGGESLPELLRLAGLGADVGERGQQPSCLSGTRVRPTGSPLRVAALLIGVNAGPLITPWASLATLLWAERLRGLDVEISWRRFVLLGLVVAPLTVVLSVLALYFVH